MRNILDTARAECRADQASIKKSRRWHWRFDHAQEGSEKAWAKIIQTPTPCSFFLPPLKYSSTGGKLCNAIRIKLAPQFERLPMPLSVSENEFFTALPLIKAAFPTSKISNFVFGYRMVNTIPVDHPWTEIYAHLEIANGQRFRLRAIPRCNINMFDGQGLTPADFAQIAIDRINRVITDPPATFSKASKRTHSLNGQNYGDFVLKDERF